MITITSYLHRQSFSDLVRRWMYDRLQPQDERLVAELVHFNRAYISRYLNDFSRQLFSAVFGEPLETVFVRQKGGLKDRIIENPPVSGPRVEELIRNYRQAPERFFRETPFEGTLYFSRSNSHSRYLGSCRIKRVRRLAEKSARRIIDHVFFNIKRHADELAEQRARRLGIRREQLITDSEEMVREFMRAEQEIIDDLRRGRPLVFDGELSINDVAGVKVIIEEAQQAALFEWLRRRPDCQVIEFETHSGLYNATNLILRYRPPRERLLREPLGGRLLQVLESKGLKREEIERDFEQFVISGEEQVHIEVIVSNYLEMLESEIGRCIHEDRIINQRMQQQYRGLLAKNVEYMMVYLFNLALAPRADLESIPIKLWYRYLPDTVDELLRGLYRLPSLGILD